MGKKSVRTICFECPSRCGVLLQVEKGKVTGIRGDKDHPFSRGYLCPKGKACVEILYHPERITRPLIRSGDRGDGRYNPVSWEAALDIISQRLLELRDQWGAESFAIGTGSSRALPPFLNRFLAVYGSPNFFGPINMSAGGLAFGGIMTMGFPIQPDFASTRCMLLWASNPEAAYPGLYNHAIREALKKGSKLIVVDPRRIPIAAKADHWLRIRPGTDVALALGFLHVIIKNKLYDKEFVDKWTVGFNKLRDYVADFTPDRCADMTWVPAKEIEEAARTYAGAKPACISPGMAGTTQVPNAFDLNRTLAGMSAITGNLEVPGGNVNFVEPNGPGRRCYGRDYNVLSALPPGQARKRLGMDRYPIVSRLMSNPEPVWDAIVEEKPYPVKTVGLFGCNAMVTFANSQNVRKALSALDFLFMVDFSHTPTTALADVILPPAHWAERDDVEDAMMMNHIFCQQKAVEPVPECLDEKQILINLAKKMGLKGYWNTIEQGLDDRLEPIGIDFRALREMGKFSTPVIYKSYVRGNGFSTPSGSGKVDLYSEFLGKMGISPLPAYQEPPESPVSTPDLYKEYPLILITGGKNIAYCNSSHRNIPSLRKLAPDPQLDIHPETAAAYQVKDGEWVRLMNPRGKIEIRIRLDEHIHPRVVHASHGYWYGSADGWERLNVNQLTNNQPYCSVIGSVQMRALLCRIEKIDT